MGKFLMYVGKIILVSYIIAYSFQALADYGLKTSEIRIFRHWDSILSGEVNSDIIILGSSRAVVSYDPDIFSSSLNMSVFNLGFDAASYNLQNIKLKTYLTNNDFPKILIQNVDLTHFLESSNIPNTYQFIPFYQNKQLRENLSGFQNRIGQYYYLPMFNYNSNPIIFSKGIANSFTSQKNNNVNNQGYSPVVKDFKLDNYNLTRIQDFDKDINSYSKHLKGLNDLEENLKNQIPSDIMVILIWAPEHFERLKYAKQLRGKVKDYLVDLDNRFSNVLFFNYAHDSISTKNNLYYDTFHLNKKGAVLFSEKVSRDLSKILN